MARRSLPPPSLCSVCQAPSLPVAQSCPFCGSPLEKPRDDSTLLDYLAAHLPAARTARRGLLGRGPTKSIKIVAGERRFAARLRRRGLELTPSGDPEDWVSGLLAALSAAAGRDHDLRAAMTRAGWALRQ